MTEMVRTLINNRWPILLPAHRAARESWAWHEAARFAAMSTVIGPGDVVWDIGAEEGDHAALYAMWGAQVVLAEPNPRVWPNIRCIFEANELPAPLFWWDGFMADEPSIGGYVLPRASDPPWPSCAYGAVIGDHGSFNLSDCPDIPSLSVDVAVDLIHVPAPTVLTIDVEGSELQVLRGATHTLEEHRPHVFVSIHPELAAIHYGNMDITAAVREFMIQHGYPHARHHFLAHDHEWHWYFQP